MPSSEHKVDWVSPRAGEGLDGLVVRRHAGAGLSSHHVTSITRRGQYLISGPACLIPLSPVLSPDPRAIFFSHLDYITHRSRNLGRKLTYCICHASAPDVQVRLNPLQTSRQQKIWRQPRLIIQIMCARSIHHHMRHLSIRILRALS